SAGGASVIGPEAAAHGASAESPSSAGRSGSTTEAAAATTSESASTSPKSATHVPTTAAPATTASAASAALGLDGASEKKFQGNNNKKLEALTHRCHGRLRHQNLCKSALYAASDLVPMEGPDAS